MRLWVLAHEIAGFTLFEAAHLRDALSDLVRQHAGGFRPDASSVTDKLTSLDDESADPIAALQQALSDPGAAPRRRHVAGAARAAPAPRRPRRRRRRLHRLGRRRRRRPSRRRRRPAHRRGRPPAAHRDVGQRRLRRAAARHPHRRGAGRPRQGVRAGRRRPCRRRRAAPAARTSRRHPDAQRGRRPRPLAGPHHRR